MKKTKTKNQKIEIVNKISIAKRQTKQTLKVLCKKEGISTSTYQNWKKLSPLTTISNNEYQSIYTLWLPSNKDIFGFKEFKDSPLNTFESNFNSYEKILFSHLQEKLINLFFQDSINKYRYDEESNKFPSSRGISFTIVNIGKLEVFSNGLYIWKFKKTISKEVFFQHIQNLFDVNYNFFVKENNSNKRKINLDNYKGILNYFQIELLLNALYDINISPSYYFQSQRNTDMKGLIEEKITLSNILKSIILYSRDNSKELIPLAVQRANYPIEDKDYESYFASSMEQFIRVSNTYSLEHYKRGLDFCLKQLSSHGVMRASNTHDSTINFLPDSLNRLESSISTLESYQTLIFEKLPLLDYLQKLYIGLSRTIENNKTLTQAIRQNNRRVEVVKLYFKNVEDSLVIENQKKMQYELSEIRKYTEMNNEMIINENNHLQKSLAEENQKNIDKLMIYIGVWTLFFTIASPIFSYILTNEDNTISKVGKNIGINSEIYDPVLYLILFTLIVLFITYKPFFIKKKDDLLEKTLIYSKHIFDNTNPNSEQPKSPYFIELINFLEKYKYHKELPSILNLSSKVKCIKFDTMQEKFPTFKTYKFSFYSEEKEDIKYILHIDVEYDFHKEESFIKDLRIVISKNNNCNISTETIHENATKIKSKITENFFEHFNIEE